MNILDDLEKIKKLDKQGMLEVEENFYRQLESSKKIAESVDLSQIKAKNFQALLFLAWAAPALWGIS